MHSPHMSNSPQPPSDDEEEVDNNSFEEDPRMNNSMLRFISNELVSPLDDFAQALNPNQNNPIGETGHFKCHMSRSSSAMSNSSSLIQKCP